MRDELREDLKEFESNNIDLEEYISNGIINEEDSIHDSLEMLSEQSFGLDNVSNYSNKLSKW